MKWLISGVLGVSLAVTSPTIALASPANTLTAQDIAEQTNHAWANIHIYSTQVTDDDKFYVLMTGTFEGHKKLMSFLYADKDGSSWKLNQGQDIEINENDPMKLHVVKAAGLEESHYRLLGYTTNPSVKSIRVHFPDKNKTINLYDGRYFGTLLTPSEEKQYVSVQGLDANGRVIEQWIDTSKG